MERSLKNKTVVITGAARGIGYEIADQYLKNGAKVVIILDMLEEDGVAAAERLSAQYGQGRAVFITCDVTRDLDTVSKKIFDTYKSVDILVNNAGIANDAAWKETIDINVKALIGWTLKFWDHMRTDKGGKGGTIINIASIFGFRVYQNIPVYVASKYAVMGFTRSLGHVENFKRSGVRVVALNPGYTETKLAKEVKVYDEFFRADTEYFGEIAVWQKVESLGVAAVEVLEKAPSGTAWLIEGGAPISEIK